MYARLDLTLVLQLIGVVGLRRSQVSCRTQIARRKNSAAAAFRLASYKAVKRRITPPATCPELKGTRRPVFPPELYRCIIERVMDRRDLCSLALTSWICYAEARRVLYRTIDLAQNTRAPVLWASTMIQHPHQAEAVRTLTLRFDLSFLLVPHMLLPSLKLISQALQNLRKLKKLVLIGHPLAMMHPIHTWILDGCTADLEIFQNSVFPPSAILSFLSRQSNLRQWKQNGVFQGGAIAGTSLPHLAVLDVHASTLAAFRTPRPLVRIRVKIDDYARDGACERGAIEALSRFGSTLSALHMEYSSTEPPNLTLAEVLGLLAKATPNLKLLVYTTKLACSIRDPSSKDCSEPLSRFPKLKVVVIQLQPHSSTAQDGNVMGERALDQCPSLRYVAVRDSGVHSCTRWHMEGHVTDEDAGASVSSIGGELTSVFGTSDDVGTFTLYVA